MGVRKRKVISPEEFEEEAKQDQMTVSDRVRLETLRLQEVARQRSVAELEKQRLERRRRVEMAAGEENDTEVDDEEEELQYAAASSSSNPAAEAGKKK